MRHLCQHYYRYHETMQCTYNFVVHDNYIIQYRVIHNDPRVLLVWKQQEKLENETALPKTP